MPIVTTSSRKRPGRSPLLPVVLAAAVLAAAVALCLLWKGRAPQPPPGSAGILPTEPGSAGILPAEPRSAGILPAEPGSAGILPAEPTGSAGILPAESAAPAVVAAPDRPPTHPPAPGGVFSDREDAIRDLPGHITLPDGNVMTFPPPEPGKTISVSAQGRVYLADSAGNFVDATPPPVFDNPVEEQMVGISTPGGHFIPGLFLANSPAAITNMLYRDVVINEDDPEDVKAKKEAVAETKQLMLSYLEAGYSLPEVVMSIAALADQERALRRKGVSAIMRMVREGDIEGARKYKETLDEVAAGQQLAPIVLPKRVAEALYGGQTPSAGQRP